MVRGVCPVCFFWLIKTHTDGGAILCPAATGRIPPRSTTKTPMDSQAKAGLLRIRLNSDARLARITHLVSLVSSTTICRLMAGILCWLPGGVASCAIKCLFGISIRVGFVYARPIDWAPPGENRASPTSSLAEMELSPFRLPFIVDPHETHHG
jgi:hypothetical protein